jgi:Mycothiol maleylpyruvate isomerase N-terminal domain
MPGGWTVASVLGHVAFWDQRIIALIEAWRKAGGGTPPKDVDESQVDWINDATKPLLLAVPPRRAAELTLSIAESTDRMVAELPEDFLAANGRAGSPINVRRAEHRREHIDEIESALRS